MSSHSIITIGVGKRYSVRHQTGERCIALRDVIDDKPKGVFRRIGSSGDCFRYRELFYLLVCHEFWLVAEGEKKLGQLLTFDRTSYKSLVYQKLFKTIG